MDGRVLVRRDAGTPAQAQAESGAGSAADRDGVSELSPAGRSDGGGEYRPTAQLQKYAHERSRGNGGGDSGPLSDCGEEGSVSEPAFRRAAAVGGYCARG